MALRIWCDPRYFPEATRELAAATALEVLAARGVTLEQAAEAYAYAERYCDLTFEEYEPPARTEAASRAWFEAGRAAEVAAKLVHAPMGSMLVLHDDDDRCLAQGV